MAADWTSLLDDGTLRRTLGEQTLRHGAAYVQEGRVSDIRVQRGRQTLLAEVQGSDPRPYTTMVTAVDGEWYGDCSCPVGEDCKHAAAVLVAARVSLREPVQAPATGWERALAELVRPPDETETRGLELGLQFEVTGDPAGLRGRSPRSAPTQRMIRLRPVIPGRRAEWVRTGISWRTVEQGAYGLRRYRVDQLRALSELHRLHRGGDAYYYTDIPIHLHELGPAVWEALDRAAAAGVTLVTTGGQAVRLAGRAAGAVVDLHRDPGTGELTLAPVVTVDGAAVPAAGAALLGDPAHGVALFGGDPSVPAGLVPPGGLLLAPLERRPAAAVSRLFADGAGVRIPEQDGERFLRDYYPGLRRAVEVTSSDDSVPLPEVVPPRLALAVAYAADHRVNLEWSVLYETGGAGTRVPLPEAGVHAPTPTGLRDPDAERRLLSGFQLPTDRLPQLWADAAERRLAPSVRLSGMDTVVFTDEVVPGLRARDDVVVQITGTPPEYRHSDASPEVRISATDSDDADWFDLGVRVLLGDEEVPFAALFTALAHGDEHLLLASGTWFSLRRPEFEQLRRLIDEARTLQDGVRPGLRISRYQAGLWEELLELGVVEEQSQRWSRAVAGLLALDTVEPPPPPPTLAAQLRSYQQEGYAWLSFLWDAGLGGILADDMGLGKTVQTLALLCRAQEAGELTEPVLVVAPTSVVSTWAREAARFAPGLRVVTVTATHRRRGVPLAEVAAGADVVITSYALLRLEIDSYAALAWRALVLDEAQFVKNHQAKTYQCARRLPAPVKLAITGTPLENGLMDLWALLSIVAPGLFPSPQRFTEFFRVPIERGGHPELLATLRRRIRPLVRRRTKEQVAAELPPKQEQVLEVSLNPRHEKVYQTHLQRERRKVLGLVDDLDANRFTIFRSLTLLRQLALDPALVDESYTGIRSSKADVFVEQLREVLAGGHRALVFSQFTGFLRTIRNRLDDDGVPYAYLDGRTRDRTRRIDEFRAGRVPVFLISLKAGGFGLNLTEADYVFVLDPWWNPAVEAQAVDRTHRIGQDKTVLVYRMVAAGTIEEKVMALKARKQDLFTRVVDDGDLLSGALTAEDIRGLFAS